MKRVGLIAIAIAAVMGAIVSGLGTGSAIALPSSCDSSPGNRVGNCGFETRDFTKWTQSGNTGFTDTNGLAHSGIVGVEFGPVGSLGFIDQALTTGVGGAYYVSFWLSNLSSSGPNRFEVSWDGALLFSLTDTPAFSYVEFEFTVPASKASTDLRFGFRHDASYFHFDDVVVMGGVPAVPGPSSLLLIGSGLGGLAIWWRRRSTLQESLKAAE